MAPSTTTVLNLREGHTLTEWPKYMLGWLGWPGPRIIQPPHIAVGLRIGMSLGSEAQAIAFAKEIGPLIDSTKGYGVEEAEDFREWLHEVHLFTKKGEKIIVITPFLKDFVDAILGEGIEIGEWPPEWPDD